MILHTYEALIKIKLHIFVLFISLVIDKHILKSLGRSFFLE